MKDDARTYELIRQRDAKKRSLQIWAAATVVWAVVIGWVLWGLINSLNGADHSGVTWLLVYLVPVLVLAVVALTKFLGLRANNAELNRVAEDADRKLHKKP